jgi:hypothetical protein
MNKKRKSAKGSKPSRRPKGPARRSARGLMSIATNPSKHVKERVAALEEAQLAVSYHDENLPEVLRILGDENEPAKVRLAALQALQTASFNVVAFAPVRGEYMATLRKVAKDPDPELRENALGVLARRKDGFAQKKLLEGLQDPEKALLPPEKALQLLSYDPHAEAYQAAREILRRPPNDDSRREALRLLSADAKASPMFEKLLRDKSEPLEIRQLAAAALHAINPEKLQEYAREIVLDPSEQDDIQAASLAALTNFGDVKAIRNDKALMKRVNRLSSEAPASVKQSARQFLSKMAGRGGA